MKIDNRRETLEISKDQALISSLQELISQRRELRVVEINRISGQICETGLLGTSPIPV